MYNIEIHDNLINKAHIYKIYHYVQRQQWYGGFTPVEKDIFHYRPADNKNSDWMLKKTKSSGGVMHRCKLATDKDMLEELHPPVYDIWQEINQKLDNQFELTGIPEGMHDEQAVDETWRVYVNGTFNYYLQGPGYIHRDNHDLNDETSVTIILFLNPIWYPSWQGYLRFYPDDVDGVIGDHQQFNSGYQQQRDFDIGWLDEGRIVSPVPGRLIVYDGRSLHSTTSCRTGLDVSSLKLVFRARRK